MLLQTPTVFEIPAPPGPVADPNLIVMQLVPLVGSIAIAIVVAFALRWFLHSPIAEAIAEGIRMRRRRRHGELGADETRALQMEDQIRVLSGQISELGERLDFAERLLAGKREPRLGAGGS